MGKRAGSGSTWLGWWMAGMALLIGCGGAMAVTPIPIATLDDLNRIGRDGAYPLNGTYVLTGNIDASATASWNGGQGFEPIGTQATPFTGAFDGQGFVIRGLTIRRPGLLHVGLFGYIGTAGDVRNLGLEGGTVEGGTTASGKAAAGFLAGYNAGSVTGCYATGTVSGKDAAGGLVGWNTGGILDSYATGTVTSSDYSGGVAGYNEGTISGSYATGTATSSSSSASCSGGVAGVNAGTISGSYATGTATSSSSSSSYSYSGGVAGYNTGTISGCYAAGRVIASSPYNDYIRMGGLAGEGSGGFTNCYWDIETTRQAYAIGDSQSPISGASGLTSAAMRQQASFETWDFSTVWGIQEGASYPYLRWQAGSQTMASYAGQARTTAQSTLASNGYTVGAFTRVCDPTAPADTVIGQSPAPGMPVSPGETVYLVLSTGPCDGDTGGGDTGGGDTGGGDTGGGDTGGGSTTLPAWGSSAPAPRLVMTMLYDGFEAVDRDGNGALSATEVLTVLPAMSRETFQAIDQNGDNTLSRQEIESYLGLGGPFGCVRRLFIKDLVTAAGGDFLLAGLGLALLGVMGRRRA